MAYQVWKLRVRRAHRGLLVEFQAVEELGLCKSIEDKNNEQAYQGHKYDLPSLR